MCACMQLIVFQLSHFIYREYAPYKLMQGVLNDFDDVFVAAGSVGTACGLAIANYLTGSKLK